MDPIARHHHFRKNQIPAYDRVARLEAQVVDILVTSDVPDERRDSSIAWELKHQAAVTQFARMLAARRSLDGELCAVGALLHDIYTIETGSYENHARRGGPIARQMLSESGGFSTTDANVICDIVENHSDKQTRSNDPYVEFGKDVDILDCFLYPHALDEYLLTKPLPIVVHYLARAKQVWTELGMSPLPGFDVLDEFSQDGWLVERATVAKDALGLSVDALLGSGSPPFAVVRSATDSEYKILSTGSFSQLPLATVERASKDVRSGVPPFDDGKSLLLVWPSIERYEIVDLAHADAKAIVLPT
jgi:hypothetical protein